MRKGLWLLGSLSLALQCATAQWVQQSSGTSERLVGGVVLDSTIALVIGNRNGILITTDAGESWTNENAAISAVYNWNSISFSSALIGTVVGDQRVVTTIDGGHSWTLRTTPTSQRCLSVLDRGSGYLYLGTDSGWICESGDTGKTWISTKVSQWPIRCIFMYQGVALPGAPIYYAVTSHSLLSKPVYPTTMWNETVLNNFEGLGSEAWSGQFCRGGGAGFIVGVFGDLWAEPAALRRSMGDVNWVGMQLSPLREGTLTGIAAPSPRAVSLCGTGGMIYSSSDSGSHFTLASAPTTHNLNAIFFLNEETGYAVGDSGTILYTQSGLVINREEEGPKIPAEFILEQNYPNPFNPATTISYALRTKVFVNLTIYDELGRTVATLVNEIKPAGKYELTWNAGHAPSGVYFCRLRAGSYVETRKLVLLW